MNRDLAEALDSIHSVLAFSPKDWGESKRDAWLYGIVCGWDEDSYKELATIHKWKDEDVERNKRMHNAYEARRTMEGGNNQ